MTVNLKQLLLGHSYLICGALVSLSDFRKSGGMSPWLGGSAWNMETPAEIGCYHMPAPARLHLAIFFLKMFFCPNLTFSNWCRQFFFRKPFCIPVYNGLIYCLLHISLSNAFHNYLFIPCYFELKLTWCVSTFFM